MLRQLSLNEESERTIWESDQADRAIEFGLKRCVDVTLAALLLVILAPLLLLIAVLIKIDSSGPVIFSQERVGARRRSNGNRTVWEIRTFQFYKFRSMVPNADDALHRAHIEAFVAGHLDSESGNDGSFKLTNDPRVTRIGRILRRTSLDELPQLVNVLKGDMSLVGPRPVPTYEVAGYEEWHHERLAALPGITGLWQVKGRCQVTFDEMVRMDIEYVRNRSLRSDIKILMLTIPAVLSGRGAG
jgi:lipopolysaccharide/colanic/teichoic acid biosynthesis glycosyltransferase